MRHLEVGEERRWVRFRRNRASSDERGRKSRRTALNKMTPLPSCFPISRRHWCDVSVQPCSAETVTLHFCMCVFDHELCFFFFAESVHTKKVLHCWFLSPNQTFNAFPPLHLEPRSDSSSYEITEVDLLSYFLR